MAWELNKGYSAPEHFAALQSRGPSVHHRRSWHLPGVTPEIGAGRVTSVALIDDDGAVRCGPMAEASNEL